MTTRATDTGVILGSRGGEHFATVTRLHIGQAEQATADDVERCRWFALCENPATSTEPHPVLGLVPICEPCADKVATMHHTGPDDAP